VTGTDAAPVVFSSCGTDRLLVAQSDTVTPTRRALLAGIATAMGAVTLAGCTGTDSNGSEGGALASGDDDGTRGEEPTNNGSDGGGDVDPSDQSAGSADPSAPPDEDTDGSNCADESVHESYNETVVTVTRPEGEQLGSVTAAIAETPETRREGLSETDCLPEDRGMLFVYEESQSLGFWMKDMEIGIDILHIGGNGVIRSIQHAEAPAADESGTEETHQYPGTGQFVLEVNYGWTTERDIEEGDVVTFEL